MRNYINSMDVNNINKFTLAQNTRADIIGELDAIIQYEAHIASSNDPALNRTLRHIVEDEKHHVGELFGALFYLDPESKEQFEEGLNEFYSNQNPQQR